MKVHIIRPNIWYVSTIFAPYSDIDSSTSETVKYDHPLWTLVSFFPPTHGFSSTIYAASLHDAYFQLLRCCRAIKGTDLSSATHWYKIGWDPRFLVHCARAHRSRFCRAFRSYEQFRGRVLSRGRQRYRGTLCPWFTVTQRCSFEQFIGNDARTETNPWLCDFRAIYLFVFYLFIGIMCIYV